MLKGYMEIKAKAVEKTMRDYLNELKYPKNLVKGMKYSIFNGGKRLRPVLLLMILEILDEDINKGLPYAAAIEFIHSYSLVHDDLPAMDDDKYRRGKLSTHSKFGEAQAILIGDSLLTHAFYIASEKDVEISDKQKLNIIRKLSNASGVRGMVGGQFIDMESEEKKIDLPTLEYIHTHKTGMLLRLPVEIALIISQKDGKKKEALLKYADLIGLAFQIKDDILDVEGDFKAVGKPIGSDENSSKATYVDILGLDESKILLEEKVEKAIKIVTDEFGKKGEFLVKLAEFIKERIN
ncbi:MAG: polyprenyl synthetase family protein [Fusobacteriota bacterium]